MKSLKILETRREHQLVLPTLPTALPEKYWSFLDYEITSNTGNSKKNLEKPPI